MTRLKVGVVGCGAIAQIHHLPNLTALHDRFEVAVVCDLSPSAAAAAARRFHVPAHVNAMRTVQRHSSCCHKFQLRILTQSACSCISVL